MLVGDISAQLEDFVAMIMDDFCLNFYHGRVNMLCTGVQGLTLSSPLVVGNHITTCLGTNVVLTCTATQVAFLRWTSVPGVLDRSLFPGFFGTDSARVVTNPYTLTLVNVTNHIPDDEIADLTSTLEVMVDDLERNGTKFNITCLTPFDDHKHLTIYIYNGGKLL